jgi:ribonuclease HI
MKDITIYTDGSCLGNPGPGGWGAVILADKDEHRFYGGEAFTTNNRMELQAAIQALRQVAANPAWKSGRIRVFCDSQYVKNGITQWVGKWKLNGWKTSGRTPVKNRDLWVQLDVLMDTLNANWEWVRGHAGNTYNELCDQLARAGTVQASK